MDRERWMAMVNAAIKAQVNRISVDAELHEGSFVKKGQLLFEIDARPFQAALAQAQGSFTGNAQLAQSRHSYSGSGTVGRRSESASHQLDVDVYIPLAKQQAITQQDLDNATQTIFPRRPQVDAAKSAGRNRAEDADPGFPMAAVERRRRRSSSPRHLGFTQLHFLRSAGNRRQGAGADWKPVNPTGGPITTVSTLEPIKAEFTVSEQEYLRLMRNPNELERPSTRTGPGRWAQPTHIKAISICRPPGGSEHRGNSTDRAVPEILEICCDRPVRQSSNRGRMQENALLVPQRAVTELQGNYQSRGRQR